MCIYQYRQDCWVCLYCQPALLSPARGNCAKPPLPSGLDCGIPCFGESWDPRLPEQRPSRLLRALLGGQGARPLLIAPGGQSCQADCCLFLENPNQTSQCSSWEVAQLSPTAGRNPSFSFSLLSLNLPSMPSLPSWPCFILFSLAWGSLKIGFLLDVDPALRILETLWTLTCPSSYPEVCLRVIFSLMLMIICFQFKTKIHVQTHMSE